MTSIFHELDRLLRDAISQALGLDGQDVDPLISPSKQGKGGQSFGDFQANAAMGLAKRVGKPPREIAAAIVDALPGNDVLERVDIAGPGFINLTLTNRCLEQFVTSLAFDEQAGITPVDQPKRVVVDYSSPNVAKQMHIGHLRSTIIGDAIARVLEALGHECIRQNHVGDWGTQFGMLIEMLMDQGSGQSQSLADLDAFYKRAKARFDLDDDFARRSRERVVALQAGDPETIAVWKKLVDVSAEHFKAVYDQLGVTLTLDDMRGESAYNDALPGVVAELEKLGLLVESDGAGVVYPKGFVDREGEPMGMIVRKSDGGYLYATTDLAAARYRVNELKVDRIVYVTDARQSQHFAMLFSMLRETGWVGDGVRLDHVPFGMVLGKDRKPFKTRAGGTVKLADVLDQAVDRAAEAISGKNGDLSDAKRIDVARAVGVGSVKYADLSSDRVKDYVFDWDRMLSLEGNTAPYLINAYVRIRSIFRKAKVQPSTLKGTDVTITDDNERALVLKLQQFSQVIEQVADSLEPHRLCTYLYELAGLYHVFYERCPVLKPGYEQTRPTRLVLSHATAMVLHTGLDLLGIRTVERM